MYYITAFPWSRGLARWMGSAAQICSIWRLTFAWTMMSRAASGGVVSQRESGVVGAAVSGAVAERWAETTSQHAAAPPHCVCPASTTTGGWVYARLGRTGNVTVFDADDADGIREHCERAVVVWMKLAVWEPSR